MASGSPSSSSGVPSIVLLLVDVRARHFFDPPQEHLPDKTNLLSALTDILHKARSSPNPPLIVHTQNPPEKLTSPLSSPLHTPPGSVFSSRNLSPPQPPQPPLSPDSPDSSFPPLLSDPSSPTTTKRSIHSPSDSELPAASTSTSSHIPSDPQQLLLNPLPNEPVIQPPRNNAFHKTNLDSLIPPEALLIVAGCQSYYCIRWTCTAALERGNSVVVVRGAHGEYDSPEPWDAQLRGRDVGNSRKRKFDHEDWSISTSSPVATTGPNNLSDVGVGMSWEMTSARMVQKGVEDELEAGGVIVADVEDLDGLFGAS